MLTPRRGIPKIVIWAPPLSPLPPPGPREVAEKGQVMYESAAQRGQGPGASSAGGKREEKGKGEEVIDADFDVKD